MRHRGDDMTPAQRFDVIVNELVFAAQTLQLHRNTFNQDNRIEGYDALAQAEYHKQKLEQECHNLNLEGNNDL